MARLRLLIACCLLAVAGCVGLAAADTTDSTVQHDGRILVRPFDPVDPATEADAGAPAAPAPATLQQSTSATTAEPFSCADGSAVVPGAQFNDDYCDCADGSDEPDTAACAHLPNAQFLCTNKGFIPKPIPSYLVGDSVCDCCDGSDEVGLSSVTCPDLCTSAAKELRTSTLSTLKQARAGLERLNASVANATTVINQWRADFQSRQASSEELRILLEAIENRKYDEELFETAERKSKARAGDDWVEPFREPIACSEPQRPPVTASKAMWLLSTQLKTVARCPSLAQFLATPLGARVKLSADEPDYKPPKMSATAMKRKTGLGIYINNGREGAILGVKRIFQIMGLILYPVRMVLIGLEYVREWCAAGLWAAWDWVYEFVGDIWTSQLAEALPEPVSSTTVATVEGISQGLNATAFQYRRVSRVVRRFMDNWGVSWAFDAMWGAGPAFWEYCFPKLDMSYVRPEAEELRSVLPSVRAALSVAQQQATEAEELVKRADGEAFGPGHRFFGLNDVCVSSSIQSYTYEVCFFQQAKQSYTSLGDWKSWTTNVPPYTGLFDDGATCWNGPARHAVMTLVCAAERTILEVSEPSTCEYHIKVGAPEGCDPAEAHAAVATLKQLGLTEEEIEEATRADTVNT